MASSKQGDGCGTLIFLAVVWWLGSKYWEYVSVGLVALLTAGITWLISCIAWKMYAMVFKSPTPFSGKCKLWHVVFLLVGLLLGGWKFYHNRDSFFWDAFAPIVCTAVFLGFGPAFIYGEEILPASTSRAHQVSHSRPSISSNNDSNDRRVQSGSYNTTDLPNETNRAGNIRDVDFDLDV